MAWLPFQPHGLLPLCANGEDLPVVDAIHVYLCNSKATLRECRVAHQKLGSNERVVSIRFLIRARFRLFN